LQGSAASSARQSAPGLSSPNSMVLDDLWELEDLVGESGDDEYDGPPNDTIRQERRQKRMRDDMVEITDELTESTIITQMLERVHEDGRRWSSPWHTRQRSAPLPEVTVEDTEDEEPEVQAMRRNPLRHQTGVPRSGRSLILTPWRTPRLMLSEYNWSCKP